MPKVGSLADATSATSNKKVPQGKDIVNKKSVRYQMNAVAQEHLQAATGDMGADVDALKQLVSMLNKQDYSLSYGVFYKESSKNPVLKKFLSLIK